MKIEIKKATEQPTKESIEEARRVNELNIYRIKSTTEVQEGQPTLSVDGVPVLELEDLAALKAKQKQGKTTALKVMVAAWLKGELFRLKCELKDPVILWIDTEQKESDVKLIINDIKQLTDLEDEYIDKHLFLYHMRKLNYKTLLEDTQLLIKEYSPQIVIVDGIVDYVDSFNDEQKSHQLISGLLVICEEYNCLIINVLHENKGVDNQNMRGHLGTMLAQKVGTVLQCKKAENGTITVSCADPRHQAMPSWRIRYDDGIIVSADDYSPIQNNARPSSRLNKKHQADAQKKKERIDFCLNTIKEQDGSIAKKELSDMLQNVKGMSRPTASNFLTELIKDKVLFESNKIITTSPSEAV